MWRVQAVVVHIFLLVSILTTYFTSTILPGLVPQKTMREMGYEPPADRLVVFLTDGLRAASFLANNGSAVPDLRDLYRTQGRMEISRTFAPTQTATGHIAVFGGLRQDPSAALVNFRYVPVHFDTVFNRSRAAIGWTHSIVEVVFVGLRHGGAPLRFTVGHVGKLMFDEWAFRQVKEFLAKGDNIREVRNLKSVVFFIYLADMDSCAHRYTPLSPEFDKKLLHTQKGIRSTYELFEQVFNDSRTAYLMTSDHGMRDTGYHGTASDHETETPLFMWGAGVKRIVGPEAEFPIRENMSVVDQIQLAPLMSALIGLPPPMNNIAMLPEGFLNVSTEYEIMALHLNVLQMLDQAEILIRRHKRALFSHWLPSYTGLYLYQIAHYRNSIDDLVSQNNSREALETCQGILQAAQRCLAYYHGYYQTPLLAATTISYFVWFYCLFLQLTRLATKEQRTGFATLSTLLLSVFGIIQLTLLFLQEVPLLTSVCLLLPTCLLIMAQGERPAKGALIEAPCLNLVCTLAPAALLILMSFNYKHLGMLYALSAFLHNHRLFRKPSTKFFLWMILVCIVSGCLLKTQAYWYALKLEFLHSSYVIYCGMLVALVRPIVLRYKLDPRVWAINAITMLAGAYGIYRYDKGERVPAYVSAIVWFFLFYAFLSVRYCDASTSMAKRRLELITMNLVTLHVLLSERWGPLGIQLLITELLVGTELYKDSKQSVEKADAGEDLKPLDHLKQAYRYGFAIVLYFYVGFELAGHWIGSFMFWPNTARLFYANYAMLIPGSLIILKIVLPSLIIISSLYALVPFVRRNNRSTFTCLLLISNLMGLYFCFYVQNEGQYYYIRKSLDTLLITHVVNFLLLGCSRIAEWFLENTEMDEELPHRDNRRVRFTPPAEESEI